MSPSEEVSALMLDLNDDEQRVLLAIAKRLAMGREQYGALDLATDPRDWTKEAYEEALDMSNYLAMALVKRATSREPSLPIHVRATTSVVGCASRTRPIDHSSGCARCPFLGGIGRFLRSMLGVFQSVR